MSISANATPGPSSSPPSAAKPVKLKPIPYQWEGVVSAPLTENDASIFLHSVAQVLDEHYIPNKRHFHLLLYLALTSPLSPLALRTISQIFSLCPPSALRGIIPAITEDDKPAWERWAEVANTTQFGLNRDVKRFTQRAKRNGGLWALLDGEQVKGSVQAKEEKEAKEVKDFKEKKKGKARVKEEVKVESPAKGRGRKRVKVEQEPEMEEEEEEEEVEEKEEVVICEKGWKLLAIFVRFWKVDQADHTLNDPDEPWSPLFLDQLPTRETIQLDDASHPLRIVKAGINTAGEMEPNSSARLLILEICKELLSLVLSLALPKESIFHPPSLLLALLALLRPLSPSLLPIAFSLIPPNLTLYPHLLVLYLEDQAGVRIERVSERKMNRETLRREFRVNPPSAENGTGEGEGRDHFPSPTIGYLKEVLLLGPGKGGEDEDMEIREKMGWAKGQLVRWAAVHYGPGPEWGFAGEEGWKSEFGEVVGGLKGDGEGMLGILGGLAVEG